ncbi:MAG: hypothetical protein RL095_2090 [Verrucomicrobiota bacterium]|jgi:hypothetical protein
MKHLMMMIAMSLCAAAEEPPAKPMAELLQSPATEDYVISAEDGGDTWQYSFEKPAEGWMRPEFDAKAWASGKGGFGRAGSEQIVGTAWTNQDIWLRKTFRVGDKPKNLRLRLQHDEDVRIYLNGQEVVKRKGHRGDYEEIDLSAQLPLLAAGDNVLAIHCHQTVGGQYIDAGLEAGAAVPEAVFVANKIWRDWLLQDGLKPGQACFVAGSEEVDHALIAKVLGELKTAAPATAGLDPAQRRALYLKLCEARRAERLKPFAERGGAFVFTKHKALSGSFYGYTEGLSDAQAECNFRPDSELLSFKLDGLYGRTESLLRDKAGLIRDPELSFDAKRLLFAWKKDLKKDDYHLYEMDLASRQIRQLTSGLGFADFEGRYLPCGDIIFSSSRGISTIPCWRTEASNMWRCDKDGKLMRRLGYDQVTTNNPSLLEDGRIVYTRWDYNDRGQIFPQPLFAMNQDGTEQVEYYGASSWFPTTIGHAREIPGSGGVLLAILHGHHTYQHGKLAVIDRRKGTQEAEGVQLVAPVRETKPVREDHYGQQGEQFQYPFPLDDKHFLVTYDAKGGGGPEGAWGIYLMDLDGRRELLTIDPKITCNHPILFAPRKAPRQQPELIDLAKDTAEVIMQDVYQGPGLKGVPRGTVKKLRVVEVRYRAAEMGCTYSAGPGGSARVSTPPAAANGSWDVKSILGDAEVEADGSARFTVPARKPIYFQPLDDKGQALNTMRTWATLMPGERFSCIGCHENKHQAPPAGKVLAMAKPAQKLQDFYGPARGFSFPKEIQPILDNKCISCHDGAKQALNLSATPRLAKVEQRQWSESYWSLLQIAQGDYGAVKADPDGRLVKWIGSQSEPDLQPAMLRGSFNSPLIAMLRKGHQGLTMTREEMDKLAAWIDLYVPYSGDFTEGNAWSDADKKKYAHFQAKRNYMRDFERLNRQALLMKKTGTWTELPRDTETEYDAWIAQYAPDSRAKFDAELKRYETELRGERRNLALNPQDGRFNLGFPKASSNSEYDRSDKFLASKAIDGDLRNGNHAAYPSWGPDKVEKPWLQVDFGREVELDEIRLLNRAEYPHDTWWTRGKLEFSDGSSEEIAIGDARTMQSFPVKPRRCTWVRFTGLAPANPKGWPALAEFEAWGK